MGSARGCQCPKGTALTPRIALKNAVDTINGWGSRKGQQVNDENQANEMPGLY